jgi:hypothetical protein
MLIQGHTFDFQTKKYPLSPGYKGIGATRWCYLVTVHWSKPTAKQISGHAADWGASRYHLAHSTFVEILLLTYLKDTPDAQTTDSRPMKMQQSLRSLAVSIGKL